MAIAPIRSRAPAICFAALHCPATFSDPDEFLASVPLVDELPAAMAERGYRVSVVQAFSTEGAIRRRGVDYFFERDGASRRRVRAIQPNLLHLHGATLHLEHALLLSSVRHRPGIVIQYQGGYPSPNPLARRIQRHNLSRADRLLFTTLEHARPFLEAGVIADPGRVAEFMETSSRFGMMDRVAAREATGMLGDPVFLSTGRLHPDKDPMTMVRGFEQILAALPDARLYLYYLSDELLPELRAFVQSRPGLARAVAFRGRAAPDAMEAIYNSADFLLQASRREFSGCAVLEAMACGVIPVVTRLPSFRAMTGDGSTGVLFSPGDADALARGALSIPPKQIPVHRQRVLERFERELSFPTLADRLDAVYREVLDGRPTDAMLG